MPALRARRERLPVHAGGSPRRRSRAARPLAAAAFLTGTIVVGGIVVLGGLGAPSGAIADEPGARRVGPPSPEGRQQRGPTPFQARRVDVHGFTVAGSVRSSVRALREAAYVIGSVSAKRPRLLAALVKARVRCCVMAPTELTTDVPEHADLVPKRYWDRRARGLGAAPGRPCVSCAEENLLGLRGDPYAGQSILIHEFAHTLDLMALRAIDPTFAKRLASTYQAAMRAGRWKGTYAAENKEEYWAEGVQSWFDANGPGAGQATHVATREALTAYDPALAALIRAALGDNRWRYTPPDRRRGMAHLRGFRAAAVPAFAWPAGLDMWYRAYLKGSMTCAGWQVLSALDDRGAARRASRPGTHKTSIRFINRTGVPLRIYWIDFEGRRKSYGTVNPGRSQVFASYAGHRWALVGPDDVVLARFEATERPGCAVLKRH